MYSDTRRSYFNRQRAKISPRARASTHSQKKRGGIRKRASRETTAGARLPTTVPVTRTPRISLLLPLLHYIYCALHTHLRSTFPRRRYVHPACVSIQCRARLIAQLAHGSFSPLVYARWLRLPLSRVTRKRKRERERVEANEKSRARVAYGVGMKTRAFARERGGNQCKRERER